MLEKQIEKYFTDKLKELGCIVWKFTSPGTAGVPDRIVIIWESSFRRIESTK